MSELLVGFGWSPRPLLDVALKGFLGLSLFWFGWAFWSPFSFFPPPVRALLFWFGICYVSCAHFSVHCHVSSLAAQGSSRPDVVSAIVDQFGAMPIAAVQFFGTEAKVTFERQEHKRSVMQHQSVCIRGVDCDDCGDCEGCIKFFWRC